METLGYSILANTLMTLIVRTFIQTNLQILWTLFMFDDTILLQEGGNLTPPVFVYFLANVSRIYNMIYILYKYLLNRWPQFHLAFTYTVRKTVFFCCFQLSIDYYNENKYLTANVQKPMLSFKIVFRKCVQNNN